MIDNSMANPGKMGWGEETETPQQIITSEKKQLEVLAEVDPVMLQATAPREPNPVVMQRVKDVMAEDGIEGGFSTFHMEKVVFGEFFNWLAQIVGSCVASGAMRAMTWRTLIEVFLLNEPEELFGTKLVGRDNVAPFAPYSYRAGRTLANMNRGDGSYCSVHIRGAKQYGILPCSTPGIESDAFPEPQSASTYRSYGNSDAILNKFGSTAKKFVLKESVVINDGDLGKDILLTKFVPFMVCSMWAFTPDYTHPTWKLADGTPVVIYKRNRRTSWAHNMTIASIVEVSSKWYVIVQNSWGPKAHKNGHWFVIPFELYATWCRDSEQMSIGDMELTDSVSPV